MGPMVAVRRFEDGDAAAVAAIVEGLPDYFTSDVPEKAPRDAERHDAWVLTSADAGSHADANADAVTGFAVVARKSAGGAEILWIAVAAGRRGHGHGTMLLGHVLDHLAADGVGVVEAKTLDASSGYQPYEATRAFWERNGFVHVDTIDPLPDWQPGNPAAIYVAALRPTR
jgi:GNAT superfamily N-acetyltransferase